MSATIYDISHRSLSAFCSSAGYLAHMYVLTCVYVYVYIYINLKIFRISKLNYICYSKTGAAKSLLEIIAIIVIRKKKDTST